MVKKKAKTLGSFIETLLPVKVGDIVELDEQWSFVGSKKRQYWLWVALCRRTMQVVAYHLGERTIQSFNVFYEKIPPEYAACLSKSDQWQGYKRINKRTHKRCQKKEGQTNCIEEFNTILRQRIGRLVRKSCAFSKSTEMHDNVLKVFLHEYNNEIKSVKH